MKYLLQYSFVLLCLIGTNQLFAQSNIHIINGVKIQVDTTESGGVIYHSPAEYEYPAAKKQVSMSSFQPYNKVEEECRLQEVGKDVAYISQIRWKLKEWGYYHASSWTAEQFDPALKEAIQQFRQANGLSSGQTGTNDLYGIDLELLMRMNIEQW